MRLIMLEMDIEYDGFDLEIEVTDYQPFISGNYHSLPENCYPDDEGYLEYEILNEKEIPEYLEIDYNKLEEMIEKQIKLEAEL